MRLNIYSLRGVIYQGEAKSINLKTALGEITVLNRHRPLVSILKPGEIKLIDETNKPQVIMIPGGFLEVSSENKVNILVDL